jgi:uncharacterized protein YjbI with pentapeptide repeats
MTKQELVEKLEKHKIWLAGDLGGEPADLSGATLIRANLYGADLRYANMCRANLTGADLRHANMYGANMYDVELCNAKLFGSILGNGVCMEDLRDYQFWRVSPGE